MIEYVPPEYVRPRVAISLVTGVSFTIISIPFFDAACVVYVTSNLLGRERIPADFTNINSVCIQPFTYLKIPLHISVIILSHECS